MNTLVRTRGGEGYDRAAFTIADVERMVEHGILPDDNSFELWEGEIVPKVTKNDPHELWKARLALWFYETLGRRLRVSVEPTLRLTPKVFVEPDLLVHPRELATSRVRGPEVSLVVEVASSSLPRDLAGKAVLYARHGVPDYWVVDADRERAFLHAAPVGDAYTEVVERSGADRLALPFDPTLGFRLADLD